MSSVAGSRQQDRSGFRRIAETFLSQPGLPFAQVLSAERIEQVFAKHGNLFGGTVYSTAIMVWAFLGQVLRDGKESSCQAAVARIVVHQQQSGGAVPTSDTGDYCRARAKLSEDALRELTVEIGCGSRASKPSPNGSGKAGTPSSSTALPSPCPTRRRTNPRIRSPVRKSRALGFPSPVPWRFFRWPRPARWSWRWALTPARKPAKPPCCAACWDPCRNTICWCSTATIARS